MATFFKSDSIPAAVADDLSYARPVNTLVINSGILYRSTSATAAAYTGVTFLLADNVYGTFGTGLDFRIGFDAVQGRLELEGLNVTAGDSPYIYIDTGNSTAGGTGYIQLNTGNSTDTTVAGTTGSVVFTTGTITTAAMLAGAVRGGIVLGGAGEGIRANGIDFSGRLVITDEFQQRPLQAGSFAAGINPNWDIVGTNNADAGSVLYAGGGFSLTTQNIAGAGDQEIAWAAAAANQSAFSTVTWTTGTEIHMKANIRTGASIADTMIGVGFKLSTTLTNAADNDQIWVGYNSAGTLGGVAANFVLVFSTAAGATDEQHDTGVTVVAGTNYRIEIQQQSDGTFDAYINNVLVASTTAPATAGITTMKPFVGVQQLGGAAKTMVVQRITCSCVYH